MERRPRQTAGVEEYGGASKESSRGPAATDSDWLMMIRLPRAPYIFRGAGGIQPNHFRFRISLDVTIAHGMMVKSAGALMSGEPMELFALEHGSGNEMDGYERVPGDAMAADPTSDA